MTISIKEHEKPPLAICKMKCDTLLHEKLEQYELLKFLNRHTTTAIIGKPKQGKSSLVWSLFKSRKALKKTYTKIFYIAPIASMSSMDDNIFSALPDEQIYNELNGEVLAEIIHFAKHSDVDEKICIVIDDMGSQLKRPDVIQGLREIAMNKRHYHIFNTLILQQTWKSAPLEVRRLYDNIILFKVGQNDLNNVFEEVLQSYKDKVLEISKLVFNKPYQFLFINVESGRLFKSWDELVFSDDGV